MGAGITSRGKPFTSPLLIRKKRCEIQGVEMEKVSIAMATYNGAKFIIEQLESLSRQSYLPHEVVVSDDCSTDGTVELIEAFAKDARFEIHIVRNAINRGYRDNFMHAASLCKSPIVAFCDQDDIWHADKLLETLKYFEDPAVKLVHHNANIVDADGRFLAMKHSGYRLNFHLMNPATLKS